MEHPPPHSRRSQSPHSRARLRHAYEVVRLAPQTASRSASSFVAETSATENFFLFSADLMCVLAPDPMHGGEMRIRRLNPAWSRHMSGSGEQATADRLLWMRFLDLAHPEDRSCVADSIESGKTDLAPRRFTARFAVGPGTGEALWRWLDWTLSPPDMDGLVYAVARDVTAAKEAEAEIRWQATHDPLTGLPNRSLLMDRMHQALAGAARRGIGLGVLFIDLDRFKPINDTLGHAAGDILLKEMAKRMRAALRDEDTVARLGGDEFVVLLPAVSGGVSHAMQVAQKLLHQIAQPVGVIGHDLYVTASIGISLFPQDAQTPEMLIRNADLAMYRAKGEGRGRAVLHSDAGSHDALERLMMQSRLRQAVDRREMRLHYQPQVSLVNGQVFGVEALMRWQPNEMAAISPAKFIPIAEETGLIVPLGGWAVEEACRQAADWQRTGCPLRISVNLSASQLSDNSFPEQLQRHAEAIGLNGPDFMDLELTESTFIRSDSAILDILHRLKDMGVGLSVDDFGTGYSSLAYLRRFPIDGVKVDRSFISNIVTNPADEAVVRAVIDLSHTLGLKVIAEGVETAAQMERLRGLGCDAMQGYYFSAAIPPRDIPGFICGVGTR